MIWKLLDYLCFGIVGSVHCRHGEELVGVLFWMHGTSKGFWSRVWERGVWLVRRDLEGANGWYVDGVNWECGKGVGFFS